MNFTEYRRVIESLRYLTHTRPGLSYAIGIMSRYMEKPIVMHHQEVNHILRYVKGTTSYGLKYQGGRGPKELVGFTDSDLARDIDNRKSTTGMIFYLNKNLISWQSQKQQTVTLSSCEAEFMNATTASCQALWLRNLLREVTRSELKSITFYVDNKSTITLMKNPVFHGHNKHIDTRFHFIRECVEKRHIVVEFVCTRKQHADILT